MEKQKHHIVGAISGSSLDGLDLASVVFTFSIEEDLPIIHDWDITKTMMVPFPEELAHRLRSAPHASGRELCLLDADLGKWIGKQINDFVSDSTGIEIICSHGHTVFHEPQNGMTCQIGNGAHIAALTTIPVINDVRYADLAAGGVGAPFAPLADQYLFHGYDFYLNLGGISNLTHTLSASPIGWDISGCNQMINHIAQKVNLSFDRDGELARKGNLDTELLETLFKLLPIPIDKAVALDNQEVVQLYFPALDDAISSIEDLLHTVSIYITSQIEKTIRKLIEKYNPHRKMRLLATGGGALNIYMMELLSEKLSEINVDVIIPEKRMIEYKEAALLALIGLFQMYQLPNSLPSVTQAEYPPIGGVTHLIRK